MEIPMTLRVFTVFQFFIKIAFFEGPSLETLFPDLAVKESELPKCNICPFLKSNIERLNTEIEILKRENEIRTQLANSYKNRAIKLEFVLKQIQGVLGALNQETPTIKTNHEPDLFKKKWKNFVPGKKMKKKSLNK